jgi:hypothetical protein
MSADLFCYQKVCGHISFIFLCFCHQRFLPHIPPFSVALWAACSACPVRLNAAFFPACAAGKLPGSWTLRFSWSRPWKRSALSQVPVKCKERPWQASTVHGGLQCFLRGLALAVQHLQCPSFAASGNAWCLPDAASLLHLDRKSKPLI